MVAQGIPQPLHIGPLAAQVGEIRRRFPDAAPGDAFIVNHPYQACQNHSTDVTIITPMFVDDQIVGYIGNTAHKPDLGGKVPGTNAGDATDLFQEGLLIPPLRILRRGQLLTDIERVICANTRTPEVTWGDVTAQVNTNTYGLTRFAELFAKYGTEKVLDCWQSWMDICETALRKEIEKVPNGLYGPESDYLDDDGIDLNKSYRISASLEVKGDTLHFILDSDPQARGPINLRPCVSKNFIQCLVKMVFIPSLPVNDGLSRPVQVSYPPEGSLLNPRFPAPVNMYVRPSQVTTSVAIRALARAVPGRVPAPGSAAGGSISSAGRHPQTGRWYSQYEIFSGGTGARPNGDGISAMDELVVNVMNTPVEAVESEFPVRVERYELAQDSGGPGTFRGGLGVRRQWRILGEESVINLRTDRFKYSSPGIFGAKPAHVSAASLKSRRRRRAAADLEGRRLAAEEGRRAVDGIRRRRRLGRSARARAGARAARRGARLRLARGGARRLRRRVQGRPQRRRRGNRETAGQGENFMKLRIGIDVGGTFTDVTAFDEDAAALVAVRKYTSNPAQPAAVMEEITRDLAADFGADAVSLILHGSTAALNTMLEGKGARVGLITTHGFRDVYEIGRQWRGDEVFNIFAPAPKMLLTRDRIYEARERLDFAGKEIEPLNADDVAAATRKLVAQGVEAVAVCFLFAYANPAHEQAAAKIIRDIAPDLYVSLSHEVNPEWREYERTASTVANAYIGPPVSRYLRELEALSLRRFPRSRALMMKSDGGAASARMLASTPIETVMSGPVAGVIGGRHLGDIKGIDNIITFDTGGTSSDMAVLPGRPLFKSEVSVARHPLRTHTVDIETIGAGGGSIASVDLGVLKVGPQSAGANPGPACYGRGGVEPTLTDALVVLGPSQSRRRCSKAPCRFQPRRRTRPWYRAWPKPLGLTPVEAAWGILTVLATNVTMAMRTITIERGYDPREFTLVPFGGMGPTIAGRFIGDLGIGRILIPRDPGTFSAFGMLVTDVHQTRSFTRITRLDAAKPAELEQIFAGMEAGRACGSDAGAVCPRAADDAAQRRHALSRPVLRSQRSRQRD